MSTSLYENVLSPQIDTVTLHLLQSPTDNTLSPTQDNNSSDLFSPLYPSKYNKDDIKQAGELKNNAILFHIDQKESLASNNAKSPSNNVPVYAPSITSPNNNNNRGSSDTVESKEVIFYDDDSKESGINRKSSLGKFISGLVNFHEETIHKEAEAAQKNLSKPNSRKNSTTSTPTNKNDTPSNKTK